MQNIIADLETFSEKLEKEINELKDNISALDNEYRREKFKADMKSKMNKKMKTLDETEQAIKKLKE